MTPADLAALHPRLYHVTAPGAAASVRRHGLLSAARVCALMGVAVPGRRAGPVRLDHPDHGPMTLTDQIPLSEAALAGCLDDGLTPADWLAILNGRVFFWPTSADARGLLSARTNRMRDRDVLVFDTLGLAGAHAERVALSPINSGSTIRKPARRGRATFTPLEAMDYAAWRRLRGKKTPDRIREVTVGDAVPDAGAHLLDVIEHRP